MPKWSQKGAKVVIADVSDERGESLAREVGAGSLYVPTNCMDEALSARCLDLFDRMADLGVYGTIGTLERYER